MAPPKHGYEKEMSAHISTIKPPVHYYEKPMYDQLSELKIPKDSYETGLLKHLSGYAPPPDDKYKVPAVCVQLRLFNPILTFFFILRYLHHHLDIHHLQKTSTCLQITKCSS